MKLLNSGYTFTQTEATIQFRYRLLNSIILIAGSFSVLSASLSEFGLYVLGPVHTLVDYIYSLVCLLLLFLLRMDRRFYAISALFLIVSSMLTFLSALIFVTSDEFRLIWFYFVIYVAYVLLGIRIGMLMTVAVIVSILITTRLFDIHLSDTAIFTGILGLVIASLLHYVYAKHVFSNQQELDAALISANQASEAKSLFLANVSHEIRTPLNGLLGMAQILKKTRLDDEQKHYLDSFEYSGKSLKSLIDELLDLSKIESGKLQLTIRCFDFFRMVIDVQIASESYFEKTDVVLTTEIDGDVPAHLLGDRERLMQVVLNLVHNAAKFTETGEVKLRFGGFFVDEGFRLRVSVNDTGVGIPEARLDEVFESFSQLSEERNLNNGVGLGLAISRQLITTMGGNMFVNSTEGEGSCFWFDIVLPVYKGDVVDCSANSQQKYETTFKILVVDDDDINILAATVMLKQIGHTVDAARNGVEAIEKLKTDNFDVVLMDVHMPVMDGVEATKIIRAGVNKDLPIIGVTASVMTDEVSHYLDIGMDAVVVKPIEEDSLSQAIYDVTHGRSLSHSDGTNTR